MREDPIWGRREPALHELADVRCVNDDAMAVSLVFTAAEGRGGTVHCGVVEFVGVRVAIGPL